LKERARCTSGQQGVFIFAKTLANMLDNPEQTVLLFFSSLQEGPFARFLII
jgi:hypothetical protein